MTSLRRIVAVGAHLDDIEIGCGGMLARASAAGAEVHMLVLSSSAYTDYQGTEWRSGANAEAEGRAAAAVLGVQSLEILDFPTKDVPYDSTTVEALNRHFDRIQPDLIVTHWPHDTHQAHRATAMATLSAARHFRSILMYEPIFPSGRSYEAFHPQVYVSIDDYLQVKERALQAHKSQWEKYGDMWLEAVKARSRLRGYDIGRTHAEAFEVVRYELVL